MSDTQQTLLGAGATLLGILVAAAMLVWQQRDSARTKVVLSCYERARSALAEAEEQAGQFASFLRLIPAEINLQQLRLQAGEPAQPLQGRFPEYQRLWRASGNAVGEAMNAIGGCELLLPEAKLLREAVACAADDVLKLATELVSPLIRALPMDGPNGEVWNGQPMEARLGDVIVDKTSALVSKLEDLRCYLGDCETDLADRLVGRLFGQSPPRRQPGDPRMLVLSTDAAGAARVRAWVEAHPLMQRSLAATRHVAAKADLER